MAGGSQEYKDRLFSFVFGNEEHRAEVKNIARSAQSAALIA